MTKNTLEGYRVVLADWADCAADATRIRHEVFVQEQAVPLEDEIDGRDEDCAHVIAYDSQGNPVGTGRLLPDGHIGRMAVLRSQRGRGLGSRLLSSLIDVARRRGHLQVILAAQVHAQDFYAAHGFRAEGQVFLDAGIDHVLMRRDLTI